MQPLGLSDPDYFEGMIQEHQPAMVFMGLPETLSVKSRRFKEVSMDEIVETSKRMMAYLNKPFPIPTIYMTYEPITTDGLWRYGDDYLVGNHNYDAGLTAGMIRKPLDPVDICIAVNRALFPKETLKDFLKRIG